jgi:hypothetical protein
MDENTSEMTIANKQALTLRGCNNLVIAESLGERFCPLLIIGMECCLVYALLLVAEGLVPGATDPFLPVWAIFLVLLLFERLSQGLKRFVRLDMALHLPFKLRRMLTKLVMGSTVLVCLVFWVWLYLYQQTYSLFDPAWLQALTNDLGKVEKGGPILVLGLLLALLAKLSSQAVEAEVNAAVLLRKGVLLLSILAGLNLGESFFGRNPDFWQTFLLLPAFCWLGLTAQALQKARQKRRVHAVGLEGGTRRQEQIIFQVMFLVGLVMLAGGAVMVLTHGGAVTSRARATPSVFHVPPPQAVLPPPIQTPPPDPPKQGLQLVFHPEMMVNILFGVAGGLFLLGLICALLLLWQSRRKKRAKKEEQDETTSLWSWSLFLAQFRSLLLSLFSLFSLLRLLRSKLRGSKVQQANELQLTREVHTIREIYRAFLRKAARNGYSRERDETPDEFCSRLKQQTPLVEPELEVITEAYALVRYGGNVPCADEVTRVKAHWGELDRKW